jgi:hypothetical protein
MLRSLLFVACLADTAIANAPGLYANYKWPKTTVKSPDIEVDHVWTTIPASTDTDGNAAFASSQYWYESYTGAKANTAGYLGTQVSRGKDGKENTNFIFSCWDADKKNQVGWTTPNTCSRFGGEGVGSHCLLEYPIKKGVVYNFRVAQSGQNKTGAFWTGTVTPQNGDPKVEVGTLFYPHWTDDKGKKYEHQ